jgi:NAD(P)-dependent dehydrogenase (short-subunit alcohol dehydrogenase family)
MRHDTENDMSTHTTINIGKRALVTGASSGIGAAIARELAALGVDLVLTARRRDALDAVAATCKGVKVEIVTADLGKPDAARTLWDAASASGPIDILINNAGFGYFRRFDEVDWARDAELIQLNMTSLVAHGGARAVQQAVVFRRAFPDAAVRVAGSDSSARQAAVGTAGARRDLRPRETIADNCVGALTPTRSSPAACSTRRRSRG